MSGKTGEIFRAIRDAFFTIRRRAADSHAVKVTTAQSNHSSGKESNLQFDRMKIPRQKSSNFLMRMSRETNHDTATVNLTHLAVLY